MSSLDLDVFAGREANVNAYIIYNASHALVIDSLRNHQEAVELAEAVRRRGKELQAVFITHGHPDHYIGCRTLKEAFPSAKILVATAAIKADIIGFSNWMESVGWLDRQPQMKPKSAANPDGFDYERDIEILAGNEFVLIGGGAIEVCTDYPPTECAHMTTLFIPELDALFTSDLCYHGVHAWAGPGVLREHIANWIAALGGLKARYSRRELKVYPGHGRVSDPYLFDGMRKYLNDFIAAVDGEPTNEAAMARMKTLYPGYEQEDFLLLHSVAFHGPDSRRS